MKILDSPTAPPPLPRCRVFDYLFPNTQDGNRWYKQPDGGNPALIDGIDGSVVSRDQLRTRSLAIGGALRDMGLQKQDVAMIFGANSVSWVLAVLGCQAADVIVSPANAGYTESELHHQIVDSTATVFFVSPSLSDTLTKALARPGSPQVTDDRIILLGPPSSPSTRYRSLDSLFDSKPIQRTPLRPGDEQNTAYLCYSSGTTGRAKGVETSHHNITSQVQALNLVYQPLRAGRDVVLGILPFSHIYGLTVVLHQPLTVGCPVVVLPRFEELPVLEAIQRHRITWGLVVPPILLVFLHSKQIKRYDLTSLVGLQSGAAPLGIELIESFEAKHKVPVTQGYGLTETSPVSHVMTTEEARSHPGQIGRLMPTFQCRLVDPDTGTDVDSGCRGEMWLRGPSVMKGYWRNPEATKATFSDGWFKTGDVAVIDDDGYYTIVDRVKELIKYKGFQVAPAELEALLLSHPRITDVAVIGVYDKDKATELPRAYVVAEGFCDDLGKEITTWVEGKVANHKRLRGGVVFIQAIPKSPSGKILRKDLRALAQHDEAKVVRAAKL